MRYLARAMVLIVAMLALVTALAAAPGTVRYVYKDSEPQMLLYVPGNLPPNAGYPVWLAVDELQAHLTAMTGKPLPVAYRDPGTSFARWRQDGGIVLAVRPEAEWKGKESSQTFTIEETIQPVPAVKITGNTGVGLLYGVYQYLNDLGVEWLTPGDTGTNIPKRADIPVTPRKVTITPSFQRRGLDLAGVMEDMFDMSLPSSAHELEATQLWYVRNRLMIGGHLNGGRYPFLSIAIGGPHGMAWASEGADFAKNPERFPLLPDASGEMHRSKSSGQVCLTNATNIETAINTMTRHYQQRADSRGTRNTDLDDLPIIDISVFDASAICQCPECKKVAGDGPNGKDRLVWSFMNKIARGLQANIPGAKLRVFTPYSELTQPLTDVKIEPNIVAFSCRSVAWENTPENQASYPFTWQYRATILNTIKAGATMQSYEYFPWAGTPPSLDLLDAAKAYKELGYTQYSADVMQRNDYTFPIMWTLAQYLRDSSKDPRDYLAIFCHDYFGEEAGQLALEIYREVDANSRNMERRIYGGIADTAGELPDATIGKYRRRLVSMLNNLQGVQYERMRRFANAFEMSAKTAEIYRAHCKAVNERTPEAIADVERRIADFQKFWPQVAPYSQPGGLQQVIDLGKTDYAHLHPVSRKELADPKAVLAEVFTGQKPPEAAPPNFTLLPEVWRLRLDSLQEGKAKNFQAVDYDDSTGWCPISSWNTIEEQGVGDIGGDFWYRVQFTAPTFPAGKKVYLRIGSLDDTGEVYLNGVKIGEQTNRDNWGTSFAMDVTDILKQGTENLLAVRGYDAMGACGVWRPSALYTD